MRNDVLLPMGSIQSLERHLLGRVAHRDDAPRLAIAAGRRPDRGREDSLEHVVRNRVGLEAPHRTQRAHRFVEVHVSSGSRSGDRRDKSKMPRLFSICALGARGKNVMPDFRIGICYDFRNPPDSGIPMPKLYAAALEQIAWADSIGFDQVWFTEHHFVDDGYLPSWIPIAAAAAARTKRVRFSTDICLLPFNNPIRLAEDLAVLDNISNGRVDLGVGIGYAPHEFRGFGIPVARRVSLADESLEVLTRCFAGERFSYLGKRFKFEDV